MKLFFIYGGSIDYYVEIKRREEKGSNKMSFDFSFFWLLCWILFEIEKGMKIKVWIGKIKGIGSKLND